VRHLFLGNLEDVYQALRNLSTVTGEVLTPNYRQGTAVVMGSRGRDAIFVGLDMGASRSSHTKLPQALSNPRLGAEQIRHLAVELSGRMTDELHERRVLALCLQETRWYSAQQPLSEVVATQFPSAAYDIDEATKCLALGR
jgi:hypothetical protein